MTISDPIADMLTRMRNALMVRHDSVLVPASKMKLAIAKVLKDEGFITDFELIKDKTHKISQVIFDFYILLFQLGWSLSILLLP